MFATNNIQKSQRLRQRRGSEGRVIFVRFHAESLQLRLLFGLSSQSCRSNLLSRYSCATTGSREQVFGVKTFR